MSLSLQFDPSSLDVARSGVIWGSVWLDFDGVAFPSTGWRDLVVAVAVDATEVGRFVRRGGGAGRLRFFDGPFHVEFQPLDRGVLVSASTGLSRVCEPDEFDALVVQVEREARKLVAACAEKGWADQDDVRRLDSMLSRG